MRSYTGFLQWIRNTVPPDTDHQDMHEDKVMLLFGLVFFLPNMKVEFVLGNTN